MTRHTPIIEERFRRVVAGLSAAQLRRLPSRHLAARTPRPGRARGQCERLRRQLNGRLTRGCDAIRLKVTCLRRVTARTPRAGLLLAFSLALLPSSLPAARQASHVVHAIDFTGPPAGDAVARLKNRGYKLRLDAEALNPRFSGKGLLLSTDGEEAGLFIRPLRLPVADAVRVIWGVERYPEGADWEDGVYRAPIAVMVFFGDEKLGSGNFFVPNAPYFVSLFLSENAHPGKAYTGRYYREGGRYFCQPCNPPTEQTVTTVFDLDTAFRKAFGKSSVPPVTSFAFQMNTEDTRGGARAYLKRVEFLSESLPDRRLGLRQ